MIVVDASAAVLGLLRDGDARRQLAEQPLATTHLCDSELVHVLRGQVARGAIDAEAATGALDVWGRLGMSRVPVYGMLARMWELRENVSGYDAGYVAVAEALDAPLLTADARLAAASGPRCPMMVVRS